MDMKLPRKNIDYCLWAISGLVFLSAVRKIRLLLGILNYEQIWAQAFIIVLFVSAAFGSVGLLCLKRWGFFLVYAYIAIATVFFSISLVPFPFGFLNLDVKVATTLLLIINLGVLAFTGFLHAAKSKEHRSSKEAS